MWGTRKLSQPGGKLVMEVLNGHGRVSIRLARPRVVASHVPLPPLSNELRLADVVSWAAATADQSPW